jgi:Glycosyl hydrolase family 26
MNWKVLASLAMPIMTVALVGGVLQATHHNRSIPSLARPPSTAQSVPTRVVKASTCNSELRQPFTGVAVTKISSGAVTDFTLATQSPVSVIEFYTKFPATFNYGGAMSAVDLNAMPLLQLDPGTVDKSVLRKISTGADDKEVKAYADAVKAFGYCIVISFGHEMNGWWYHWGAPWNTPATFIKAWRHVHDIFAEAGANNVIWSWDPSHQYTVINGADGPLVASPASQWYPGKKYVDWIGLDGYLGSDTNGTPQNFDEIFAHQIAYVRQVAPHKLLYLAETAVSPTSAEPHQIKELFEGINRNHLAGLIWFNENKKQDWRLRAGMKEAIAAYSHGVSTYPRPGLINVPRQ